MSCAMLAESCFAKCASLSLPSGTPTFVWQLCPQTCGACPETCPSTIDVREHFVATSAFHQQRGNVRAWWRRDVRALALASVPRNVCARPSVRLRPGQLHVDAAFASEAILRELKTAMREWSVGAELDEPDGGVNLARVRMMSSSASSTIELLGGPAFALVRELLGRMTAHVNSALNLSSTLTGQSAYAGGEWPLHLGSWALYQYQPDPSGATSAVVPHVDADWDGRCLSAALHLAADDADSSGAVQGGIFRAHTCDAKAVDCADLQGEKLRDVVMRALSAGRTFPISTRRGSTTRAPFAPGALVSFLAETPHSVTPLLQGRRNVLFAWFHCSPPPMVWV